MDQPTPANLDGIAAEAFDALVNTRQITPFSSRPGGLTVADAYRVTSRVRKMYEASGATPVGRKIGFTNRGIWAQYNVYAPVWGHMFDRGLHDLATSGSLSLAALSEPRIEPEIVFGLGAAPRAGMDEAGLLSCIAWVALGFEIVQSVFPGWVFAAADTIAANGVHGALMIGPRHAVAPHADDWQRTLPAFDIALSCNGALVDEGHGGNVLDGPLSALRHLVELLAADPHNPPLAAGEVITTGTLTKAMPIAAGESWTATPTGIALEGITLRFCEAP
ncbi:fumarylacetoacetate hydrolase family protein [soil metagenome]